MERSEGVLTVGRMQTAVGLVSEVFVPARQACIDVDVKHQKIQRAQAEVKGPTVQLQLVRCLRKEAVELESAEANKKASTQTRSLQSSAQFSPSPSPPTVLFALFLDVGLLAGTLAYRHKCAEAFRAIILPAAGASGVVAAAIRNRCRSRPCRCP